MNILLVFPGFIIAFIIVLYYERKIRLLRTAFRTSFRTASRNKVHFYVARDKNGVLCFFIGKPFRGSTQFYPSIRNGLIVLTHYRFKSLGLNKKDFQNLKWEDEPVEVFLNLED